MEENNKESLAQNKDRAETLYQPIANDRQGGGNRSKMVIALVAIVAACAIIGVVALAFGRMAMNAVAPGGNLQAAIENTVAAVEDHPLGYPDLNRYKGSPTVLDFTATADLLDETVFGYEASAAAGSSVDAALLYDGAAKKMLARVSVNAAGLLMNDNELFVSEDLIAVAVPMLYSESNYITADPATLAADWNASDFGIYGQIPAGTNVQEYLDAFFGQLAADGQTAFQEEMKALSETLVKEMQIVNEGEQETTLGGEPATLERFACTIPAEAMTAFYNGLADSYERYLAEMGTLSNVTGSAEWEEAANTAVDAIRALATEDDFLCYISVSADQLVRKIEVPETLFDSTNAVTGAVAQTSVGLTVDLYGTPNPLNAADIVLTVGDGANLATVRFSRSATNEGNILHDVVTAALEGTDAAPVGTLRYQAEWDKNAGTFTLTGAAGVGATSDAGQAAVTLTGNLTDADGAVTFSDGTLTVNDGARDILVLQLSGGVSAIDGAEIAIDETDSVSLFELSMMDLLGGLMPLMQ